MTAVRALVVALRSLEAPADLAFEPRPAVLDGAELAQLSEGFCPAPSAHSGAEVSLVHVGEWAACPYGEAAIAGDDAVYYYAWRLEGKG